MQCIVGAILSILPRHDTFGASSRSCFGGDLGDLMEEKPATTELMHGNDIPEFI